MRWRSQRKTTRVLDPPVFCVHPCIAESVVPFRYPWTPKRWMKEWNNNVMGLLKGIVWWRVWGVWECPESIEMNGIGWIIILSGTLAILCCLRSTLWSVSSNTSNSCEKTNTRKERCTCPSPSNGFQGTSPAPTNWFLTPCEREYGEVQWVN